MSGVTIVLDVPILSVDLPPAKLPTTVAPPKLTDAMLRIPSLTPVTSVRIGARYVKIRRAPCYLNGAYDIAVPDSRKRNRQPSGVSLEERVEALR
jgi:hypothetical protein